MFNPASPGRINLTNAAKFAKDLFSHADTRPLPSKDEKSPAFY
jgi:hypothetical protein